MSKPSFPIAGLATLLVMLATGDAQGETRAELVSSTVIWDQAPRNMVTDLVRFKDRWFVVCVESTDAHAQDGALRVLASDDGAKWESVAAIDSPTPNKSLRDPRFSVTTDGRLTVAALAVVPDPRSTVPVPMWGGTVRTMAWSTRDGRTWDKPDDIGPMDYPFSRVVWNKDVALSFACGCICGSMQTVQFFASKDGKGFESRYKKTFSGFFPEDSAIAFDGETAYCLMSRVSATVGNDWQTGWLGTAKAPYDQWEWKELDTRIGYPNMLRLGDKRMIAAVGLVDPNTRTSLCEFDPSNGKLTELLELPANGNAMHVGLAEHDGHVWVSYHAIHKRKWSVHLAKVKLR